MDFTKRMKDGNALPQLNAQNNRSQTDGNRKTYKSHAGLLFEDGTDNIDKSEALQKQRNEIKKIKGQHEFGNLDVGNQAEDIAQKFEPLKKSILLDGRKF